MRKLKRRLMKNMTSRLDWMVRLFGRDGITLNVVPLSFRCLEVMECVE